MNAILHSKLKLHIPPFCTEDSIMVDKHDRKKHRHESKKKHEKPPKPAIDTARQNISEELTPHQNKPTADKDQYDRREAKKHKRH